MHNTLKKKKKKVNVSVRAYILSKDINHYALRETAFNPWDIEVASCYQSNRWGILWHCSTMDSINVTQWGAWMPILAIFITCSTEGEPLAENKRSVRALIAVGFGVARGRHLLFLKFKFIYFQCRHENGGRPRKKSWSSSLTWPSIPAPYPLPLTRQWQRQRKNQGVVCSYTLK